MVNKKRIKRIYSKFSPYREFRTNKITLLYFVISPLSEDFFVIIVIAI